MPQPTLAQRLSQGYVIFDLETTGLDPQRDRILEIGLMVVHATGETDGPYARLMNPGIPVPAEITAITGITQEEVDTKGAAPATVLDWADTLVMASAAPLLVGHNVLRFDMPFLRAELRRACIPMPSLQAERIVDTAALYKGWKLGLAPRPDEPHHVYAGRVLDIRAFGLKFNLGHCCAECGVDLSDVTAHRAAGDVLATHRLLQAMLPKLAA